MKLPRLLVADIDGTLIETNEDFPYYTRKVLKKLHDSGVLFGIASGRACFQIKHVVQKWNLGFDVDLLIGLNGVELYDCTDNKTYLFNLLKKEIIKKAYDMVGPYAINSFIYRDEAELALICDEKMKGHIEKGLITVKLCKSPEELWEIDNAKIMFRFKTPEDLEKVRSGICDTDEYKCFKTQTTLLEFADPHVDKAVSLQKYCELHDIDLKDVVACGDNSNDNGMLKAAGTGICLKDGADDTKESSDEITDLNCKEEGLAHYLVKKYDLSVG